MIEVTSVEINEKEKMVVITGTDVESFWVFGDEPDEDAECKEISYKFDISEEGARTYLYLVTKNNREANRHKYMPQKLKALVGQSIYLSENFRVKEEKS